MKTQIIEIKTGSTPINQIVEAVQGDSGRVLRCIISDMSIPAGSTARFYAVKPSGAEIYNDCAIDGQAVVLNMTTQMLAEVGTLNGQIEVTNSGKTVTSFSFCVNVIKNIKSNSAIESSNEFTALDNALKDAEGAAYKAVSEYADTNGLTTGATPEQVEQIEQNTLGIDELKADLSQFKNGYDMFTPTDWESGYINAQGQNLEEPRYERTHGYYSVKHGEIYTITVGNGCGVTFRQYDENKVYKSQQTVNESAEGQYKTQTLTIPSGISYIRITVIPIDETTYANHVKGGLLMIKPYTGSLAPSKRGLIISASYTKKQVEVNTNNKTISFSDTNAYCYVTYGNKCADIRGVVLDYSSIVNSYGYILFDFSSNAFVLKDASIENIWKITSTQVLIGLVWNDGKTVCLNVSPYYVVNGVKVTNGSYFDFNEITKIAILGDSISTFLGYSESGLYQEFYPTGDVTSVEHTWWKQVCNALRVSNISVSAVSSSQFNTVSGNQRPPLWDDNRIARLGSGGPPSIVFINGGTNDPFTGNLGTNSYKYAVNDLNSESESTLRGCALTIRKIQTSYPNARIIGLIPKFVDIQKVNNANYTFESYTKMCDGIKNIYKQYGCEVIDLRECGINYSNVLSNTIDGIHPNANGMKLMADYVISKLLD